jgi:hypothetical protein
MIDLRKAIAGIVRVMLAADFPEAGSIAKALHLDMAHAVLSTMKGGNLIIRDATLDGVEVYIIAAITPRRDFYLFLRDAKIRYRDIEDEVFGDDQRINKSRYSEGFAVVFHIDGLECALTPDSQDAVVDAILCRPPKPDQVPRQSVQSRLK